MKKIFITIIAMAISICMFGSVSYASTLQPIINADGGSVGDIIEVTVAIPADTSAVGGSFNLVYDNTKVELLNAEAGEIIKDRTNNVNDKYAANRIRVNFAGTTNISPAGGIALKASFMLLSSGSADFSTEKFKLLDIDTNQIPCENCNTSVTIDESEVGSAYIKISSAEVSVNDTVDITVDLSGNSGFANLGIQVGYDANNLTLTSVTSNANVGATYIGAQSITANPYNLGWNSTSNVTYNGNLATLTFKVKDDAIAGTYPITVSYYMGVDGNYTDGEDVNYDADFNSLNLQYINGAITISSHIAGDINGDGKVNNQDGTFLLRHLAGWNVNVDETALDINGDGKVNNQDGTVLLRYLAGWSVTIH